MAYIFIFEFKVDARDPRGELKNLISLKSSLAIVGNKRAQGELCIRYFADRVIG
jgi:hypothetical protein